MHKKWPLSSLTPPALPGHPDAQFITLLVSSYLFLLLMKGNKWKYHFYMRGSDLLLLINIQYFSWSPEVFYCIRLRNSPVSISNFLIGKLSKQLTVDLFNLNKLVWFNWKIHVEMYARFKIWITCYLVFISVPFVMAGIFDFLGLSRASALPGIGIC